MEGHFLSKVLAKPQARRSKVDKLVFPITLMARPKKATNRELSEFNKASAQKRRFFEALKTMVALRAKTKWKGSFHVFRRTGAVQRVVLSFLIHFCLNVATLWRTTRGSRAASRPIIRD